MSQTAQCSPLNGAARYVAAAARGGKAALLELPESSRQFLCPIPYPEPSSVISNDDLVPANTVTGR